MHRLAAVIVGWLCLVVLTGVQSCAAGPDNYKDEGGRVTITTTTFKVTDKTLAWRGK